MTKGRHRLPRSLRHPVGPQRSSVYWMRRALLTTAVFSILGLISFLIVALLQQSVTVAGSNGDSGAMSTPTTSGGLDVLASPTPIGSTEITTRVPVKTESAQKPDSKKSKPSPSSDPTSQTEQPSTRPEPAPRGSWTEYPWGSNGLECPHPSTSSGASSTDGVLSVVVLGDSLVRNARSAIDVALGNYGIRPVFVCWGGKTLGWGGEQVEIMRNLGLTPDCLVINLGTNDLKGTTANGLADAVPLSTVDQRLVGLLQSVSDIPHVFAVDIAANLNSAPSTMSEVLQAPEVWRNAVGQTGVGEVIPWASNTQSNPGLIGADGIHDSDAGVALRAGLIAQSVARYCA